jgi:hypothetical protein
MYSQRLYLDKQYRRPRDVLLALMLTGMDEVTEGRASADRILFWSQRSHDRLKTRIAS